MKKQTKLSSKEILKKLQRLQPKTEFIFNSEETNKQSHDLKTKYPILYEAYQKLTIEEIESPDYKIKEIQKFLILKNNKVAEYRILKMLPLYFIVGARYTKAEIKEKLQEIYEKTGYTDKAKSEHLQNKQWYDTKDCKIWNNKSKKYDNGFEIIRPQFLTIICNK